ncbi:AAA family ATPase [Streptomyces luteogriseus]|uniref:nSTAND1 domain-containing NTPase n=1 Tax=Streptomyces luteogriseus TaxID=68233 RepID=UPI00379FD587
MAPWPRRLVVVAVDEYFTEDDAFTAGIQKQVETITGWLADPAMDAARRFEVAQPKELIQPEDLRLFLTEQELAQARWDQALVLYITGHGLRGQSRRHYLTFGHTSPDRLLGTAFPTSELITQVMDSEAEHVLVLVDSCFAGSLKSELGVLFEELCAQRRGLKTLAVITSGDFEQEPHRGEFTRLLKLALDKASDESAGFTAPHLSFQDWEKLLNTVGDENPGLLRALWVWPDSRRDEPSLCLPNPHYEPQEQVVEASRQPVSLSASTLQQYWLARASGRTADDDPGWYFSGRQTLMQALVEFVHDGAGVLVVTGAAGSGKSALLARLVTLSDPLFISRLADMVETVPTRLRPQQGAVDAAVLARGKSSLALIEDLLAALGADNVGGEPPLQTLLDRVASACAEVLEPVTLVVDGLDEAQEPTACLSDVIAPLARLRASDGEPTVRLVLGMRSSAQDVGDGKLQDAAADQLLGFLHTVLQAGMGESSVPLDELRTDDAQTVDDITAYVEMVLQATEDSPYAGYGAAAAEAAAVVAQAVTPSFLDARLAAAQLRAQSVRQDIQDPLWRGRLLAGTTALLSGDLRQVAEDQDISLPLLLAVLRATAFAQGAGLPWAEVWPAVAAAVLGPAAPSAGGIDAVIRTVRHSRLVGYLATGEEDGRVTYRPAHQRVTEVLLTEPGLLAVEPLAGIPEAWAAELADTRPVEQIHRAIAEACARLAEQGGRLAPHPYVRRHTVAHAALGRMLDDSIMPVELAVWESSGSLRGRLGLPLPVGDPKRQVLTSAGLIEPYLDASVDTPSRFSSISFHLKTHVEEEEEGKDLLPASPVFARSFGPRLRTQWGHWQARTNVVASPVGRVHALCSLATADGRQLLATSTRYGIGVWDSTTGQQLTHISTGVAHSLTVAKGTSGRPFLVAAGPRSAGVFDPLSGRQLASLELPGVRTVVVAQDGADRWTMVVASGRDELILWKPSEDVIRPVRLPDDLRLPDRLTWVRDPQGRGYHLCKRHRAGWVLFNPLTGDVLPLHLPFSTARSMAAVRGPSGGDLLAVLRGGRDEPVTLFDPFQIVPLQSELFAADSVQAGEVVGRLPVRGSQRLVALAALDGAGVAGIVTDDAIEVWDVSRREPRRVGTYPAQPRAMFAGIPTPGKAWKVAVTGDEGVLLPGPRPPEAWGSRPPGFSRHRLALKPRWPLQAAHMMTALPPVEGAQRLAVPAGPLVEILDARTGQRLDYYELSSPVTFLEAVPTQDGSTAVAVGDGTGIRLWSAGGGVAQQLVSGSFEQARCCAVRLPDGQPALVVADRSGTIVVDAASGEVRPLPGNGPVSALLALPSPAGRCLVAGTLRSRLLVWDVASGEPVEERTLPYRTAVTALCLVPLPNNRVALAIATPHEIAFWDPQRWSPMGRIDIPYTAVMTALPQPSGAWLLAAGNGTGMRLWDPLTGRLVHCLLTAAPVTNIVHTIGDAQRVHIAGPAGLATLSWPLEAASL